MRDNLPPFHRSLWALAAAAWIGTLLTDLNYWRTADFVWVDASDWLVAAGVVIGFVALVAAAIEAIAFGRRRAPSLPFVVAAICAWLVAVIDLLVHSGDSWTSVVPFGVALSALTVVVLALAYWLGRPAGLAPAAREVLTPESAR